MILAERNPPNHYSGLSLRISKISAFVVPIQQVQIPRMARSASRDLTQEGAMFQSSSSFLETSITKEEFCSTSSNPPVQGVDVHETRHSFDHRSFGWVYCLGIAEFQRVLWFSSRTIWEFWDYQNHLCICHRTQTYGIGLIWIHSKDVWSNDAWQMRQSWWTWISRMTSDVTGAVLWIFGSLQW